jgi:hypothetical protein
MTHVRPPQPLGLRPSFGFGDRLGLATLGHVDALRAQGGEIQPVFAQQSMRELARTGRKPSDVMADTVAALKAASYLGMWSADADHLKTQEDANATAGAGFVWFTLDSSEHVYHEADQLSPSELSRIRREQHDDLHWSDQYLGKTVNLAGTTLTFDSVTVLRAAIKFGRALSHATKLAAHIDRLMQKCRHGYEIELSLDETFQPATPIEHWIIADQCLQGSIKLTCLALRYASDMEPAIDYAGDRELIHERLAVHAEIAREIGPHKLSLHDGSDKFSLYETLARETRGLFHVKTAGTSYLEGLRVAARHERKLFRRIVELARQHFEKDRASYRVSAQLDRLPHPAAISDDARLERIYLDEPGGRQVLHVTFGSVLTDHSLGPMLRDVLRMYPECHRELIGKHLGRHLQALGRGLGG